MTAVLLLLAAFIGGAVGWVLRFHMEQGRLAEWRMERVRQERRDDLAVLRYLEMNNASSEDDLIANVDVSAGRVRDALERLERDAAVRAGYPDVDRPGVLMFWRNWSEPPVIRAWGGGDEDAGHPEV